MPPVQDGSPNQPVSLEMIYYRLTQLEAAVQRGLADIRTDSRETKENHDERIRKLEEGMIRVGERMTLFAAAQAVFATVASTVAAFIRR